MSVQYPQDITEQEGGLGYQLQEIDNPEGQAVTPPVRVKAVVFQQATDPSERVVKVSDSAAGGLEYHRQVHGVWLPTVDGDQPTWKLCGRHEDPAAAVAHGAKEADLARLGRSIVASPPAISREHGA